MKVIKKIDEMRSAVFGIKSRGMSIGFVPTMGYLHEGHLSLVRESLRKADVTVVSMFVNPAQFGPREDFKEYPRDLNRDSEVLEREGVDYLFVPESDEIYHQGHKTYVEVCDLQDKLCGRSRPGHFRGVCTVVLKLFNIINPDISFFGQKDAQQAIILKRMVKELNLEVIIEVLPIIREEDGLALSSRNKYLTQEERKAALILSKSLKEAQSMMEKGQRDSAAIIKEMKEIIGREPLAKIDYVEIVDMDKLNPVDKIEKKALVAMSIFIGKIRLIDNTILRTKE
ncbi:Pantothenate synthetase [subsurface metagenome]